jgi:predicted RNA methylase
MRLSDKVLEILKTVTIDGNVAKMPQLARPDYVAVNKALECLGGKWNRKAGGHVFDCDPNDPIADAVATGEVRDFKKELQFFPTPESLATRMVELADLTAGDRILEPSFGNGSILRAIRSHIGICESIGVEINPKMVADVKRDNYAREVFCADFLTCNGELGMFDRIVMNPPFTRGQDIAHVRHAYGMLNDGGRLVAITAPGWTFRNDKKHTEFREWVEALPAFECHDLDSGTFKESGTMVATKLVVMDK